MSSDDIDTILTESYVYTNMGFFLVPIELELVTIQCYKFDFQGNSIVHVHVHVHVQTLNIAPKFYTYKK